MFGFYIMFKEIIRKEVDVCVMFFDCKLFLLLVNCVWFVFSSYYRVCLWNFYGKENFVDVFIDCVVRVYVFKIGVLSCRRKGDVVFNYDGNCCGRRMR